MDIASRTGRNGACIITVIALVLAPSAAPAAVTTTFDNATGELTVTSDADDTIIITVVTGGSLLVSGNPVSVPG